MAETAPAEAITVYEPVTNRIPKLGPYLRGVRERRPFMREVARSELKAKHYDTLLGPLWLILNPLLMAAVWLLVREVIRPVGNAENRPDIISHLIIGLFLFQFTANLMNAGAKSILGAKKMLLNSAYPRLVFPLVTLRVAMVELVPTLGVYAIIHVLLGQPVTWNLLWFPLFLAAQIAFTFGLVLFLAALTVFIRDTTNMLRFITRLWMFCSPILYTVAEIPPHLLHWLQLNPLFPYFAAYEQIFDGVAPDLTYLWWSWAWAAATMLVGSYYFLTKERTFVVWL